MPRLFRHREAVHIWRSASRRCSRGRWRGSCHPDDWVPRCASWALRAIGNGMERPAFKRSCADRDKLGSCAIDCTYLSNDVADNEAVSAFGGGFKKNQGRKLVQPLVI